MPSKLIILQMENSEKEDREALPIIEIVDYVPHAIVIETIIRKGTSQISVMAFAAGERLTGNILPFDNFILVIDGEIIVSINHFTHSLSTGQSITIPAQASHFYHSEKRSKLLSTIINSGYENNLIVVNAAYETPAIPL